MISAKFLIFAKLVIFTGFMLHNPWSWVVKCIWISQAHRKSNNAWSKHNATSNMRFRKP